MLDRHIATATIFLGESEGFTDYYPPPRTLESINKDFSSALTAEIVACVEFMHQITPSPLYPRRLFFVRLLKLYLAAFQMVLVVKKTLEIQENWVQSLGQEDPLEEEMATHSSIIA